MKQYDVVVVGSGLFGSMTTTYLRNKGKTVLLIDNQESLSGSKCSAGVFTESWITKIQSEVSQSLKVLEKFMSIDGIEFWNPKFQRKEQYLRVDVDALLNIRQEYGELFMIEDKGKKVFYKDKNREIVVVTTECTVICAGIFTNTLLHKCTGNVREGQLDGYWGSILEYDYSIDTNLIQTWAPYKQQYAFNFERDKKNLVYFGDGSMVKNLKRDDKRISGVESRLLDHASEFSLDQTKIISIKEGIRPYIKDNNWIQQHDKFLFSATGGAKNTTVLSGFIAKEIFNKVFTK